MDLMTGINAPSVLNLLYHLNMNYICENYDTKFIVLNLKVNMKYIGVFLHLQRSYWLVLHPSSNFKPRLCRTS
jgi:hypothetical protein